MNPEEHVITLISNVRSKTSLENKVAHFHTKLPQPLELFGDWQCALTEVTVPGVIQSGGTLTSPHSLGSNLIVNVKCDLIEPNVFSPAQDKILRSIVIDINPSKTGYTHQEFTSLQFHPVAHRLIRSIEIQFTLPNGQLVPFESKRSYVTLVLQRIKD